jgi:hypothetical protein
MELKLVQQDVNECVLACVSMISGVELDTLREKYSKFINSGITLYDELTILHDLDIKYVQCNDCMLHYGRVYVITVNSLNEKDVSHRIVVDCRYSDIKILDPNKGVKDKLFYQSISDVRNYWDVIEFPYLSSFRLLDETE